LQTTCSVHHPRKSNTGKTWSEEHYREHQHAGHFWQRRTANEARYSQSQCANPRYRERQNEVRGSGISQEESSAIADGSWAHEDGSFFCRLQSAVEVHLIVLCARSQVMEKPRSVRSPKTKQQQMGFIDYRTENKCYHDETGL